MTDCNHSSITIRMDPTRRIDRTHIKGACRRTLKCLALRHRLLLGSSAEQNLACAVRACACEHGLLPNCVLYMISMCRLLIEPPECCYLLTCGDAAAYEHLAIMVAAGSVVLFAVIMVAFHAKDKESGFRPLLLLCTDWVNFL